jgi:hypothetical protein
MREKPDSMIVRLTCSYPSVSATAVMSTRGFMISCTSVLTKLTIPESITCSSLVEVWVISTASASSSIEISLLWAACSLMRLLVRTRM